MTSHSKILISVNEGNGYESEGVEGIVNENVVAINNPWSCEICEESNTSDAIKCITCGVKRMGTDDSDKKDLKYSLPNTDTGEQQWACEICTFLNSLLISECEMCGCKKQLKNTQENTGSSSNNLNSKTTTGNNYFKLSFRGGGMNGFLNALLKSVNLKEWTLKEGLIVDLSTSNHPNSLATSPSPLLGVAGILQKVENDAIKSDLGLSTAFADIENLMKKASEMVN